MFYATRIAVDTVRDKNKNKNNNNNNNNNNNTFSVDNLKFITCITYTLYTGSHYARDIHSAILSRNIQS